MPQPSAAQSQSFNAGGFPGGFGGGFGGSASNAAASSQTFNQGGGFGYPGFSGGAANGS